MPLFTAPDGSHTFSLPVNQGIGSDLENFLNPRRTRPAIDPPHGPEFTEIDLGSVLGREWTGVHWFRWTLGEQRGVYKQRGYFEEDYADFSDGDMVADAYETLRLPFDMASASSPALTGPQGGRMGSAEFSGVNVMIAPNTGGALFKDTGTGYETSISAVTGYTMPAGASIHYSIEAGQVNGAAALFLGHNAGAVSSLQVLSDLANPPTAALAAIGTFTTFGTIQTEVDGNSVQVYTADASGGIIKTFNTNVALGSATVYERIRIPRGGYAVGQVSLGEFPECIYVVPQNGVFLAEGVIGGIYSDSGFRGKMVRVDQRAFTVYNLDSSLDYVLWATKTRYGLFYCDGRDHQYMTAQGDVPVHPNWERPLYTGNHQRICRGHWQTGDRVGWEENAIDRSGANATTLTRFEYDIYSNRVFPISQAVALVGAGVRSMGGPRLPYSRLNGNVITHADQWRSQYISPRSESGYNKRHVDGAPANSAPNYASSGFRNTPIMRSKRYPKAKYLVRRVIGPPRANLRDAACDPAIDATSDYANAYTTVAVTGLAPVATFRADNPYDVRETWPYDGNDHWTEELQVTQRGFRDTGGANASEYTGNYGPVTIEGFFVEERMALPSNEQLTAVQGLARAAA